MEEGAPPLSLSSAVRGEGESDQAEPEQSEANCKKVEQSGAFAHNLSVSHRPYKCMGADRIKSG